jgi:deoxyribodipyrimidine photo-lyase
MACIDLAVGELETNGWLVNQTRMWLASHWSVRHGAPWSAGEERFFTHLLDGSRAANRVGWQWTVGALTGRPYGFSRSQVEKRAPSLCARCPHRGDCPIETWPDPPSPRALEPDPRVRRDPEPEATAGPAEPVSSRAPDCVWLTAESLGDDDPALAASPDLPVVFAFDEPLLARLQLSAKRLVFLAECLADLASRRRVEVFRGTPAGALAGRHPAVTFAPVPGFRERAEHIDVAELHPWPWLRRPSGGSVASFSAWRKGLAT